MVSEPCSLTPDDVVGLVERRFPAENRSHLIERVAAEHRNFLPTLLSALDARGEPLNEAARFDLRFYRERRDRYASLLSRLRACEPSLVAAKGVEVSALYPPGLVRHLNDLDLAATDLDGFWRVATILVEEGWEPTASVVFMHAGRSRPTLTLQRVVAPPPSWPDQVELSSVEWQGNALTVPPVVSLGPFPALARHLAHLTAEGLDRSFTLRDLVDARLLADRMTPADGLAFTRLATDLALAPQYRRLLDAMAGMGLVRDPPLPAPPSRLDATRRRSVAAVGRGWPPAALVAGWLQHGALTGSAGRVRSILWRRLERVLDGARAERLGLWRFGIPVPLTPDRLADVPAVARRSVLSTPVGTFLVVGGRQIPEGLLGQLGLEVVDGGES